MRDFDAKLDTITADNIKTYFEIKLAISIDKLTVKSPVNRIDFHVMQTNILFLLCLQDINKLRIYLNNLKDQVVIKDKVMVPIVRLHEHLFLIWGFTLVNYLTNIN